MKPQDPHPAFIWIIAILCFGVFVNGCITIRESGAHDVTVNTNGNHNEFALHTERANSGQTAQASASLPVTPLAVGDEALKTIGKTVVGVTSGGLSTIPQAAAKIADSQPLTGEPK